MGKPLLNTTKYNANRNFISSKGRRNGFPFCPGKVDVSTYNNWITLGGYDKTTAGAGTIVTQDQINESLKTL